MDDRPTTLDQPAEAYRCPGETRTIDHAVHMGRLAAFYPACRDCVHRDETRHLAPSQQRRWAEILRRARRGPQFTAEGLAGSSPHDADRSVVRRLAGALATVLWRDHAREQPPSVLVGADGHWTTAELVAAACESLQLAGCGTLEAGAVTSPSLAAAAHHLRADAALWVGNSSGLPHAIGLKLWGPGARPWSSPGALDPLRALYESNLDRPQRRGGGHQRAGAREIYLAPLAASFHGLRPLRLVLDTLCEPLVDYLRRLNEHAACEILRPRASTSAPADEGKAPIEQRLAIIGRDVSDRSAHFGIWIDGDGERCQAVDERGRAVDGETLFVLLAGFITGQKSDAALVLEAGAPWRRARARYRVRSPRGDASRQATFRAMQKAGAVFGGGTSGRFWYAQGAPAPDALMTLSLLLTILSQSDRPFSEVLDAA